MEKNKFLSAKEARAMSEFSDCLRNRVYKHIAKNAKENKIKAYWSVEDYDEAAIQDLVADLQSNGYTVTLYDSTKVLTISW